MTGRGSDDGNEDFEPRTDGDTPGAEHLGGVPADNQQSPDAWSTPGSENGEQPTAGEKERDDDMTEVFGSQADPRPIEPGNPSLEHAFFVVLGVLTGIGALLSLVGII